MLPTHWSPEQAVADFEMLDELREHVWARYGVQKRRDAMATVASQRQFMAKAAERAWNAGTEALLSASTHARGLGAG
jgi:hypothetical protein